jgi:hypothetical protein
MFNSDTFANRPAFGIVGRIFISTDTKEFFRDTGTSWELIGGPGSGTITGSGAATQVAFWNGASTITGSNNLFWDSTNNYLGINTNTPTTALDIHHSTPSGAILNQTTGTNNNTINFQTSGSGRWRIGNFYTAGADDFGIFDVVGSLQQLTILKTTGQTFIGAKTTASGRLVVNSSTADAHLQIVGANAPSIRIDNAGSGGTQRFVFGLATATNNFIQGATAGEFCISTQSAGNMLFGMWQTINASEVMRITTSNNLLIGSSVDGGQRLQVNGKVNSTGYFLNGMTAGNGALYWSSDRVTLANYNVGGSLNFEVNGGIGAATINASGNFLINSSVDSGEKFQVTGTAKISSDLSCGNDINLSKASTPAIISTTNQNIRFVTNGFTANLRNDGFITTPTGLRTDGATQSVNLAVGGTFYNNTPPTNGAIIQGTLGIGTSSPVSSALLDITSTTKGFLPPRMTTTEKNAIGSPAAGLVVYDTTLNKLCVRTASTWETITSI